MEDYLDDNVWVIGEGSGILIEQPGRELKWKRAGDTTARKTKYLVSFHI